MLAIDGVTIDGVTIDKDGRPAFLSSLTTYKA
jgi:hypothetical protein